MLPAVLGKQTRGPYLADRLMSDPNFPFWRYRNVSLSPCSLPRRNVRGVRGAPSEKAVVAERQKAIAPCVRFGHPQAFERIPESPGSRIRSERRFGLRMAESSREPNRSVRWAADMEFVFGEAVRIAALPFDELSRDDVIGTLPHPNGGGALLLCGLAAEKRIWAIAEEFLSTLPGGGRVETEIVVDNFKGEIVGRFLKRKLPITEQQVDRAIARAVKRAFGDCVDMTYFIPCHLTGDREPDSISIGPVTFRRTEDVLCTLEPDFEHFVSVAAESIAPGLYADPTDHGRMFVDGAKKYFGHFDWVAEVTVVNAARQISGERARLCVQSALDVFRLILGSHGDHIRLEGPGMRVMEGARIVKTMDGEVDIHLSQSPASACLGENWWAFCRTQFTDARLAAIGPLVGALASGELPPPLCQRILDALSWFGQAIDELSPGAAIVKFVSAIERLTQCGKKDDDGSVARIFRERAGALSFDFEHPDLENWRRQCGDLYSLRSKIVHGDVSPLAHEVAAAVKPAEHLTRWVVIRALDFFVYLGVQNPDWSARKLDAAFDRFVQDVADKSVGGSP